ncbi:MAG TPA: DUF2934 domain-containing protein [Opitutaceae bacterium]|nr:DUF2934 domain-containing protein [Opitutaceae bacterium]
MKLNQAHLTSNRAPAVEPPAPTEAEIQKEAYYLWIENGRPEGRDVEFWHAAAEVLRHRGDRSHARTMSVPHVPPGPSAAHPGPAVRKF